MKTQKIFNLAAFAAIGILSLVILSSCKKEGTQYKITLSAESLTFNDSDDAQKIKIVSIEPELSDEDVVSWSSSDEKVATAKGKYNVTVTPVGKGDCTVTVKIGNSSASCNVKVGIELTLDKTAVNITDGSKTLKASTNIKGKPITWSVTEGKEIVNLSGTTGSSITVSPSRKAGGKAVVTASCGNLKSSCEVRFDADIKLSKSSETISLSTDLSAITNISSAEVKWSIKEGDKYVSLSSNSGNRITVFQKGTEEGTATIEAAVKGGTASCKVTTKRPADFSSYKIDLGGDVVFKYNGKSDFSEVERGYLKYFNPFIYPRNMLVKYTFSNNKDIVRFQRERKGIYYLSARNPGTVKLIAEGPWGLRDEINITVEKYIYSCKMIYLDMTRVIRNIYDQYTLYKNNYNRSRISLIPYVFPTATWRYTDKDPGEFIEIISEDPEICKVSKHIWTWGPKEKAHWPEIRLDCGSKTGWTHVTIKFYGEVYRKLSIHVRESEE